MHRALDVMKDAFLQFQIPMAKVPIANATTDAVLRMARAKGGAPEKMEEPRAAVTHCYAHTLNLGVSDTIKYLQAMKDCLCRYEF